MLDEDFIGSDDDGKEPEDQIGAFGDKENISMEETPGLSMTRIMNLKANSKEMLKRRRRGG